MKQRLGRLCKIHINYHKHNSDKLLFGSNFVVITIYASKGAKHILSYFSTHGFKILTRALIGYEFLPESTSQLVCD